MQLVGTFIFGRSCTLRDMVFCIGKADNTAVICACLFYKFAMN